LRSAGCERIFSEKASGKNSDGRPEFRRLMKALRPGDTVTVASLDRLARSGPDLLNIVHELQEAGCGFTSLRETCCDTTTPEDKLMLTLLGGLAEFERTLIKRRTDVGIANARKQGKKFRRPSALDVGKRRKIAERYAAGETIAELARDYDCGEATIWRALRAAA
jgi:DNA invertase Pin-like site-specific DNA recombinase